MSDFGFHAAIIPSFILEISDLYLDLVLPTSKPDLFHISGIYYSLIPSKIYTGVIPSSGRQIFLGLMVAIGSSSPAVI